MNKKSNILFSVIIPTYNRAGIIGRAIESVLAQTYQHWELIVVDDGSTDNTKEIVMSYNDKRIRYFWKENEELNAARNTGIELSEGDYICFLDDDDFYLKEHLYELEKLIRKNNFDIAIYKMGLLIRIKNKLIKTPNYSKTQYNNPVNYILFGDTNLLPLAIHKSIFSNMNFNKDCLLFDDHNFLVKVLLKYPLYEGFIYTSVYIQHHNARTIKYFQEEKKIRNLFNCINNLFKNNGNEIINITHKNIKKELVSTFFLNFAHKAVVSKHFLLALKYLFLANQTYISVNNFKESFIVIARIVYRIITNKSGI